MTILEQRFMETLPNAIRDLSEEVRKLRKELAEIKEQMKGETQPEE